MSRRQERELVTTVCKAFSFDAAHHLPNHDGQCKRPHGHTYTVEVYARGFVTPQNGRADEGMVVDFGHLKRVYELDVKPFVDHQDLNQTIGTAIGPTTAENIAGWILEQMTAVHGVYKVRVYEQPTSWAEVVTSGEVYGGIKADPTGRFVDVDLVTNGGQG